MAAEKRTFLDKFTEFSVRLGKRKYDRQEPPVWDQQIDQQ